MYVCVCMCAKVRECMCDEVRECMCDGVSDFVFPQFNAGPRLCLGRPLAYVSE